MVPRGLSVRLALAALLACPALPGARAQETPSADSALLARARVLARELILVDTHIDLPSRLVSGSVNVAERTSKGDFDYVRAREGGLDAAFMSIYVSSSLEGSPKAGEAADRQIQAVGDLVRRWPDRFALVTSPAQVRKGAGKGRILLAMGMENGAPILGDLRRIAFYHRQGIRYITLAHAKSNHLADASYDTSRKWNGLSPFGREAVREMNRTGIMVDVSHLSDSAFYQVLRHSAAPVIASHSSCRAFTPGFERNMDDGMIRALAAGGGVIQINFGSSFIDDAFRLAEESREKEIDRHLRDQNLSKGSDEARRYARQYRRDHPAKRPGVAQVAHHIDHAVRLAGVDHVGLGSDFDGVGDTLPTGLRDVADYPNLIAELLRLGYTRDDLTKICGGNLLRVWEEVERTAATLKGKP